MKRSATLLRSPARAPLRQRGVVLLFSLIAMVILLIAAVALVRSFHTSLFTAGNVAFKRDMRNQSEYAVNAVLTAFRTGALSTPAQRASTPTGPSNTANYSATMLLTDAQGIPTDLALTDVAFAANYSGPDIVSADSSIKVRYVVDRMCSTAGDETVLSSNSCVLANNPTAPGGSVLSLQSADQTPLCATCKTAAQQGVVFRLSIRVTGPRDTQSFFQSTFTVPS
jgi:type IV pilus assembly protein PilX